MTIPEVDLLILGSGSTAFAAALRAQEMGKTAVMTEERVVGGTCANRGCLPSKNLIEAAKLLHDARHPRYPGLKGASLGFDFRELIAQKDEVVEGYRAKKYQSLVGGSIGIEEGHAVFVDPQTLDISGKVLRGKKILIATGARPVLPEIDGLDKVPYLTSGYIALELGQMFQRFGSNVTIVERKAQLLTGGYEPEVGPAIAEVLEREHIHILLNTSVRSVRNNGEDVVATTHDGRELRATRLLVATGRCPNSDAIGLDRSGVRVGTDGEVFVDHHLRTNVAHIFAAGDVIGTQHGNQMATPVGSHDGGIVAHNAFSDALPRALNHRVVPRAIFIDPPLATVGMTEREAVAAGYACWCKTVPMTLVPRAGAIRETTGFVKMVADQNTHQVLGVTMFGNSAAEVIHEAAMGLRLGARVQDFIELLHIYPTMAEAMKIAAISRFKDPARLSCCAE